MHDHPHSISPILTNNNTPTNITTPHTRDSYPIQYNNPYITFIIPPISTIKTITNNSHNISHNKNTTNILQNTMHLISLISYQLHNIKPSTAHTLPSNSHQDINILKYNPTLSNISKQSMFYNICGSPFSLTPNPT